MLDWLETAVPRSKVTSVSLYGRDCFQLTQFIAKARQYAEEQGERFVGISFDVDEDGFMYLYAAGLDPIRL